MERCRILDEREYEVFKKYNRGWNKVNKEDLPLLEEYAAIGLVEIVSWPTNSGQVEYFARLTPQGRSILWQDRLNRNWALNFLYTLYALLE